MTSLQALLVAHAAAAKAGQNIEELAASLDMKVESLNQRLNAIRKGLRDEGATEEEIAVAIPKLVRRTTTRTTSNKPILASLLASVRAAAEAEADADTSEDITSSTMTNEDAENVLETLELVG